MAQPPAHPPTRAELLLFLARVAPWLRILASRWGNGRWGLPATVRLPLRRLADQAEELLTRSGRR